MTKREVIKCVLDGKKPPYVPWSFKFTKEPKEMLQAHYGVEDLDPVLGNHIMQLGSDIGFFNHLGGDLYQDVFQVVWDRRDAYCPNLPWKDISSRIRWIRVFLPI